jgi:hypothetical protein
MLTEKSTRRMPLRQLLTHSEKCSRDLIDYLRGAMIPHLTELRELSRPVRRRSSYPSMITMSNSFNKLDKITEEARHVVEYLQTRLEEILTHSRRA